MALWREFGLQLRRALPKASTGDVCLARPRRFSTAPWRTGGVAKSSQWNTGASTGLRSVSQGWKETRRCFSVTAQAAHGHITPPKPGEEINVTFIDKDGTEVKLQVAEGDNLLDIAQANDLEMEGACGGSCACSTCHVIVEDPDIFDKMEEPSDDENDMLDLAFGLTETSRLGCQVIMTKDLDGLVVRLPSMTRNLQASDFESK
ncbi:Putative 2Fe-2S iron-sulfur cluster binding domain protein [Penicillium brasilianum]|uniref:Putative 2Fe-2S iron-sulfur cluster binding domain protein n=1 Tax=Penicillium brasilianum TaxID=104259 RepID=A0A0F7TUJ8_PENBI|nr:Putative 2Fe-2S iron-sulfur cluster binding domain protein [Penicillium brasilianum]